MNITHLLKRCTGLSEGSINHCENGVQNNITILGAIMMFTAFISAGFMSYAISVMCFNEKWMMPVIFVIWFIFVYLFERLIIAGKNIRKSSVLISRIIAALVFALVHSLVIDTLFFQKDIYESFNNERNAKQILIASEYDQIIQATNDKTDQLRNENSRYRTKILELTNQIASEADGTGGTGRRGLGPVYRLKSQILRPEINLLKNQININKSEVNSLVQKIKEIEYQRNTEKNEILEASDHGLLTNIRQLHYVTIANGDFISKLFVLLWFLIFVFIESLPLLAKLTLNIVPYYKTNDNFIENHIKLSEVRVQKDFQTNSAAVLATASNDRLKIQANLLLDKMNILRDTTEQQLISLESILMTYDERVKILQEKYVSHNDTIIIPFTNKIKKEIQIFVNQLKVATS